MQLIIDVPPALRNGSVTPVSGISLMTPPMITNVCSPRNAVAAMASSAANRERARSEMPAPRMMTIAYSPSTSTPVTRPICSQSTAKMKSVE